jgi:hypothetical protein
MILNDKKFELKMLDLCEDSNFGLGRLSPHEVIKFKKMNLKILKIQNVISRTSLISNEKGFNYKVGDLFEHYNFD